MRKVEVNKVQYGGIVFFSLLLFFLLNLLTNVVPVIPSELYFRGLLIISFLAVCIAFTGTKKISMKQMNIVVTITFVQMLAYIFTCLFEDYFCFDIHRLAIMLLMMLGMYFAPMKLSMTERKFDKVLDLIIFFGLLSSFYTLIINRNLLLDFNLSKIMFYTDRFKGIFSARSAHCFLLCVGSAVCIMRISEKKKRYYVILLFFLFNIILSNARTSIVAVFGLIAYEVWTGKKNNIKLRRFLLVTLVIIILVTITVFVSLSAMVDRITGFMDSYSLLFTRNKTDITNGRIALWTAAFQGLGIFGFFFGHGIGTKDSYLSSIGMESGSFHSMYIDLLFEGGIFLLAIFGWFAYRTIKKIKSSKLNFAQKKLFYELYVVVGLSGLGDAVPTPFLLDTASIFSTLMLFTCPLLLINWKENDEKIHML